MNLELQAQFTEPMLDELTARWGAAGTARRLDGGSTNLVYEITTTRPLVLRVSHHKRHALNQVRAELEWIAFLARNGLTVCRPILSRQGNLLEEIACDGQAFVAAVFERAPGTVVRRGDLDRAHMIALGRLLGRLHLTTAGYPKVERVSWDHNLKGLKRLLAHDAPARDAFCTMHEQIKALPRDRESFGLVHNDLHMRNYHVDGGNVWLFDFDSCLYNWHASDIACTWYFSLAWISGSDHEIWDRMRRPILDALLDGYRQVNALSDFWIEQIPLFFRFRALSLYAALCRRGRAGEDDANHEKRNNVRTHALATFGDGAME